jgi:ADP-heptose:LPS heptosyltransferase
VAGTRWDIVVDLRNSAVSRLILGKKRYIFGSRIDKQAHKVEQAAAVMKLSPPPAPKLYFTKAQNDFAARLTAPNDGSMILGVGPSANWIGKIWAPENFVRVIAALTEKGGLMEGARVAVFAAPGEEAQARPVLESVPEGKRIDGIAKGNPGEAGAALAACDFYIGNDSGLLHMAAAAGVPCLGLYGPSWPHLYAPWGDHTGYACTPQTFDELIDFEGYSAGTLKHSLMTGLTAEHVLSVLEGFEPLGETVRSYLEKRA